MSNRQSILIIDDNEHDRLLYKEWLGNDNYTFIEADNGNTGMQKCLEHMPACILVDFLMPQSDGFQMLIELRNTHKNETPIIFLSGYKSKEMTEDALALGANHFLSKEQLTAETLKEAIDELLIAA